MLDTVRAYGEERLEELDEARWLRVRYRDHYLRLAKQAERSWAGGSRQVSWYMRMMDEHPHLRASMELCLAEPAEIERGLDLAASLWFLWHACGLTGEGAHYLDRALLASRRPRRSAAAPSGCAPSWPPPRVTSRWRRAARPDARTRRR